MSTMPPMNPSPEGLARLRWLVDLRWIALFGVSVAAASSVLGIVPGLNIPLTVGAVVVGVLTNLWFGWRARRRGETDDRHIGQALLDTGALTLVVWAAGGAECPFVAFYVFPMLLAALLGGRRSVHVTGAASGVGIVFQVVAVHVPALRVGRWDPPEPWDDILVVVAVGFTVGMAGYFAHHLTSALRTQVRARREADAMLRLAFEGLDAGVEVIERGRVAWQNPRAEALLGERLDASWCCPGRLSGSHCPRDTPCDALAPARQCRFAFAPRGAGERIFEMLAFPLPAGERFMSLYLDRTAEVLNQQKLVLTERLASLGRTVQGVAHELNTPLATIQTLGRDVLDAVALADLPAAVRDDLGESAGMIVAEVQRCRRITHALLGRMEQLDGHRAGSAPLSAALDRAVAVVFTHDRDRVSIAAPARDLQYPLDPLVQIFVNLLQNARDADPQGTIEVDSDDAGDGLRVRIRDHGPGLPSGSAPHLFEPFFTTKPPGKGTGLGLYTSYTLAQSLGGQLALEDHPEGGAVATVTLPAG